MVHITILEKGLRWHGLKDMAVLCLFAAMHAMRNVCVCVCFGGQGLASYEEEEVGGFLQ